MQAKQRGPAFTRKGRTKPEREGAQPERANSDKFLIPIKYNSNYIPIKGFNSNYLIKAFNSSNLEALSYYSILISNLDTKFKSIKSKI